MEIIRKILASICFAIGALPLAYIAMSIPLLDSFSGLIFMLFIYGTNVVLFCLGAIFLWGKQKWKIILRNFILTAGIYSLLVAALSPVVINFVFEKYDPAQLESFNSLGLNALIGSLVLFVAAISFNFYFSRKTIKEDHAV